MTATASGPHVDPSSGGSYNKNCVSTYATARGYLIQAAFRTAFPFLSRFEKASATFVMCFPSRTIFVCRRCTFVARGLGGNLAIMSQLRAAFLPAHGLAIWLTQRHGPCVRASTFFLPTTSSRKGSRWRWMAGWLWFGNYLASPKRSLRFPWLMQGFLVPVAEPPHMRKPLRALPAG